jgi:hypothetical protein
MIKKYEAWTITQKTKNFKDSLVANSI